MKTTIDAEKRYERQSDIFCGKDLTVAVIGVGAVGRQIALQLSAMGVSELRLVDFDTVEDVNLCAQGFRERDLGKSKVEAVAKAAWELNKGTKIIQHEGIYSSEQIEGVDFVFCCVDNMASRKQIAEEYEGAAFFDSRMAARVCAVKTINDAWSYEYYMKELFTDDEMVQETCTAKTTLFCANICAGIMIAQMVTCWQGSLVKHDICFDIAAMTFFVREGGDVGDVTVKNDFTLEDMTLDDITIDDMEYVQVKEA